MNDKKEGQLANLTVEILKQIRDGIGALRDELKTEMCELRVDVGELSDRVGKLNGRFDHLLDFSGDRYRNLERRIKVLERKVLARR